MRSTSNCRPIGPARPARSAWPARSGQGVTGRRLVRGLAWHDDLGGMGAGYAAALGGQLCSALGSESDPTSQAISQRLAEYGIAHDPIRVLDRSADWTLLITSGEFGDKLPIGFRGCHAALAPESSELGPRGRATCVSWPRSEPPGGARLGRAGRRHAVFRADDAKHARPRISGLGLCRRQSTS